MRIAIVGGGLTGCLAALEFADRGCQVVIFDKGPDILQRASVANEGKIHLGYVYGADPGFHTAARLIDDALLFRAILLRWMTVEEFDSCVLGPFKYVIPGHSKLPAARIKRHFTRIEQHIRDRKRQLDLCYLGQRETPDFHPVADEDDQGGTCLMTQERGVWPPGVAAVIKNHVARHPNIETLVATHVSRIAQSGARWTVVAGSPDASSAGPFDKVVNAAWADRRNIDRRSGFPSVSTWFTRYKFGVLLKHASRFFPGDLPTNTTATSGAFGDGVYYHQDDSLYCSWYPVGMCYATSDPAAEDRFPRLGPTDHLIRETWRGFATIDPAYASLPGAAARPEAELIGDLIVARGASDIHDPSSGLHQRWDHGPQELAEGYWTIETGKYTSAARCAMQCVDAALGDH